MGGGEYEVLLFLGPDSTTLTRLQSMTVDRHTATLYWADAEHNYIGYRNFSEQRRTFLIVLDDYLEHLLMDNPVNGGDCTHLVFKNLHNCGIMAPFYLKLGMLIHLHENNHNAKFERKQSLNFRVLAILKNHMSTFATNDAVIQ